MVSTDKLGGLLVWLVLVWLVLVWRLVGILSVVCGCLVNETQREVLEGLKDVVRVVHVVVLCIPVL